MFTWGREGSKWLNMYKKLTLFMDGPEWRRRHWATANMQERKSGAKTKVTFFSQDVTLNTGTSNGLKKVFSIALELLSLLEIIRLCKNNSIFKNVLAPLNTNYMPMFCSDERYQKKNCRKLLTFPLIKSSISEHGCLKVRKSQKQFFLYSNKNKCTLLCFR